MNYKLYLIQNLLNLKCYVGLTKYAVIKRFQEHSKRGFALYEAIQKYGEYHFSIKEIDCCNTAEEAAILEKYYITLYRSKVPYGYNLTDGGDGTNGWVPTEEQRQKCSERVTALHSEKKVGMYGKTHSEETKQKISEAHKGKPKPWLVGRTIRQETIDKLIEINTGRKHTEDTKEKISKHHHNVSGKNNPMYGKQHSPETIEKIRAAAISRAAAKNKGKK